MNWEGIEGMLKPPLDTTSSGVIFFIHRGPLQLYTRAAILQASIASPNSQIVLLSDQPEASIPDEIRSRVIRAGFEEYAGTAKEFSQIYRFDGSNGFDYELLNFQRWFFVHSYCERHSLDGPILVLDSDAFLYVPIDVVEPRLTSPMTVVDKVGPQFTFFRSRTALAHFTTFLTESFSTNEGFERLASFVREFEDVGIPHVSDMAAFGVYSTLHKLDDLGSPERNDFIFCENIGTPQGLVMGSLGKKIKTRKTHRYFSTLDGRAVTAGGIHLQGGNKALWPYFVDPSVRSVLRESSPLDYARARRTARKKALSVGLLRFSTRLIRALPR